MQEVQSGNYQVIRKVRGKDEISRLADSFYKMMDEIQTNLATIQQQEERERQMEYSLLVSQIDPHFIYNTLNTITYLAELNRTEDITIINPALTRMLKDRLRISRLQIYDTIENEKKQIIDYVTIQTYLCNNAIQLDFLISEDCTAIQYPKNVLQPFVENSILHGIALHRNIEGQLIPGIISISIFRRDEFVVTEIQDNGTGMSQEQVETYFENEASWNPSETHEHIGIYNIRMRMVYLYGSDFEIQAKSASGEGLKIEFRFPFKCEAHENR